MFSGPGGTGSRLELLVKFFTVKAMQNLIPFGKYKGKEIEQVAEDKHYLEWLCAQAWFRERHGDLYQVIINNFAEPEDTPEHNKLQACFLDKDYCLSLLAKQRWPVKSITQARFEASGIDVSFEARLLVTEKDEEYQERFDVLVELKPTLSDNYPSVLRQMTRWPRHNTIKILVIGSFESSAIDVGQLREIFRRNQIRVLLADEI